MGKCLITKLNGSVQNDSLLRIGEFCIKVSKVESPTADSQKFSVRNAKDTQLRIIGNGYFTNETLSENKGKVMDIAANTETLVYYSNGDYEIVVSEKYSLGSFGVYLSTSWGNFKGKLSFDIESLKYSPNITNLMLSDTQITGDISVLGKLTGLQILFLSNTQITGDISVLGKLTRLVHLKLSNTQITGDISVLGKLTGLTDIPSVMNTKVTGDISVYKNTKTNQLQFKGTRVYGDLSVLPNNILWVQGDSNTGTFTWTGIKNRTNILALEKCKCNNIDAFLNDMATLEAKFIGEYIWYKTISLIGTRTSASDAAVQTLQSKGYTVSITPA
jgi:Leucine-rich repeat (LRR) protein